MISPCACCLTEVDLKFSLRFLRYTAQRSLLEALRSMRLALLTKARLQLGATIKSFYNQYVTHEDRLICALILLVMGLSSLYLLINAAVTHYSGYFYLPLEWIRLSPVVFAVMLIGLYAKDKCPRLAFFTRSYTLYFFILFSLAFIAMGIQYTPFARIDTLLLHADQSLGFSTPAVIAWTGQHAEIKELLKKAYWILNIEMFAIPLDSMRKCTTPKIM